MNIAFLPIRKNSKGIKNKNRKLLNNKPLFTYMLRALLESNNVHKVILATDDDDLIENFNFLEFQNSKKLELYRRSDENAEDFSSTESVILEFITNSKLNHSDNFILAQATSPLLEPDDIDLFLNSYIKSKVDSMLSVVEFNGFIWSSQGNSLNYNWKNRPRRQDILNKSYQETGALYVSKVQDILNTKNRLNGRIGFYVLKEYQNLDIDTIEDFIEAENILKNRDS